MQLFSQQNLGTALDNWKQQAQGRVASCTLQQLEDDMAGTVEEIVEAFTLRFPALQPDNITRKRTNYGDETIEIAVPFDGDRNLFLMQPNRYDARPPRVESIEGAELLIKLDNNGPAQNIKRRVAGIIEHIDQYLGWQREQCEPWIPELRNAVSQSATERLQGLRQHEQKMAELGWPER